MQDDCIIDVSGLVKRFGEKAAIDNVNMKVKRGEMYAFLGPNGAGKTTTVRVLSTLTGFDEGTVIIDGHDIVKEPREAKAAMLDAYPGLKKMYSPDDDNTMVLYFDGGTATITSFGQPTVTIRF